MNLSQALITGKGLSLGEALETGGMVTALGLTIVFSVLIILMIVLMLFKVIFYREPKKAEDNAAETDVETEVQPVSSEPDNDELIAVLTAAVAASLKSESTLILQTAILAAFFSSFSGIPIALWRFPPYKFISFTSSCGTLEAP